MENNKNKKKTFITHSINTILGGDFDIEEGLVWGIIVIIVIGIIVILWSDFGGIRTMITNLFSNNKVSTETPKMNYGAKDITKEIENSSGTYLDQNYGKNPLG